MDGSVGDSGLQRSPWRGPAAATGLGPLLSTIEEAVIPRLVRAHRVADLPPRLAGARSEAQIDAFVRALTAPDEALVQRRLQSLARSMKTAESVYCDLLVPAARRLQAGWADDQLGFEAVSEATGRLLRLMHGLGPRFRAEAAQGPTGRRVLLVSTPGEQHTFGLSMVAEFFLRAGWDVRVLPGCSCTDAMAAVRDEHFDVVGMTVGSASRLTAAATMLADLRRRSMNRSLRVIAGGPLCGEDPRGLAAIGADEIVADVRRAPGRADYLLSCVCQIAD